LAVGDGGSSIVQKGARQAEPPLERDAAGGA